MSINEQVESAWKRELPKVRESLQCSRASQVLGAAEIGFAAGYLAALRSLYVEVKPEDVEDGELCDVKTDDGFQSAFALIHGAEISFWYHEMEEGEVREIFISPLEIKAVYRLSLPSPAEAFGEGV